VPEGHIRRHEQPSNIFFLLEEVSIAHLTDLGPLGFLSQELWLQKRELFVISCQFSIVEGIAEAARDAHSRPRRLPSPRAASLFPHAGSEENGREELKAANVAKHFCIGSRQCRGVRACCKCRGSATRRERLGYSTVRFKIRSLPPSGRTPWMPR